MGRTNNIPIPIPIPLYDSNHRNATLIRESKGFSKYPNSFWDDFMGQNYHFEKEAIKNVPMTKKMTAIKNYSLLYN